MGVMLCEPPLMVKGVMVQMCHKEYLKMNVSLPVDQWSTPFILIFATVQLFIGAWDVS